MDQDWTEIGKRSERKRRRQVLALLAVVMLCAGIWVSLQSRSSSSSDATDLATRGINGGRTVDTSPFELPEAESDGATTLPEEAFGTSVPETTTSTTYLAPVPTEVQLRATANISSLCGISQELRSFVNLQNDPTLDAEGLTKQLLANLDRYVEVAPADARDNVVTIRAAVQQIVGTLEAAGWNATDPQFTYAIESIGSSRPPYEDFLDVFTRVQAADDAVCAQQMQG